MTETIKLDLSGKVTVNPKDILLKAGDFATFYPGEPLQALCMAELPATVRKAVFKNTASLCWQYFN